MALVGWWPLINDLKDYSGYNNHGSVGATITYSPSRFGTGRENGYANIANNSVLQVVGDLSICFWLYMNDYSVRRTIIGKAYGGEYTINIATAGQLQCYCGTGGGNTTPYVQLDSSSLDTSTWYFICFTKGGDSSSIKRTFYINNVEDTSTTADSSTAVGSASSLAVTLGYGYTGGYVDGIINDVRIYNHVLSKAERAEIMKSKLFHYSFDICEEPTTNILSEDLDTTFETATGTAGFTSQLGTSSTLAVSTDIAKTGSKSLKTISTGSNRRAYIIKSISAGNWVTFSADVYSTNATPYLRIECNGGDYSWAGSNSNTHSGGGWERLSVTFYESLTSATSVYFFIYSPTDYASAYFDNMQVELKPYNTPYVQVDRDRSISDSSGYKRLLSPVVATTPKWGWDKEINSGYYEFTDGVDLQIPNTNFPNKWIEPFSVTAWVYVPSSITWPTGSSGAIVGRGSYTGSHGLRFISGTDNRVGFYVRSTSYTLGPNATIGRDAWYFLVGTWDGVNARMYVNGELQSTESNDSMDGSPSSLNWRVGSIMAFAGSAGPCFRGRIADIRLYSSWLSNDDIKDMYYKKIGIDKNGNIFSKNFNIDLTFPETISLGKYYNNFKNISETSVAGDLVAWHPFKGSLEDKASASLAEITSATFSYNDFGNCLDIANSDNTNGLKILPYSYGLDLNNETIAFWQKASFLRADASGGSFDNWVFQYGNYYSNNSGGFGLQSQNFYYFIRGPGASGWTNSGIITAMNSIYDELEWIHYVFVFESNDTIRLYANGSFIIEISLTNPNTEYSHNDIRFGRQMLALLSDVRVYDRVLSAEEIGALYNSTKNSPFQVSNGILYTKEIIEI